MNLVIDRGNTLIKIGVFEEDQIRFSFRTKSICEAEIRRIIKLYEVDCCILSAVRTLDFPEEILESIGHYIRFTHHTGTPLENMYKSPETLGIDRLAAAVGAYSEWPGENILVIDTGTCITLDLVSGSGTYEGGNISPGPELRLKSMHTETANLPLVRRPDDFHLVGLTTEQALQNGGFGGCIAEITGWIDLLGQRFGELIVVISGGDAELFATSIKKEIFVRPNLVLDGLNQILRFHADKN